MERIKDNIFLFIYLIIIVGFTIYFVLDTFVISDVYYVISNDNVIGYDEEAIIDDNKYEDDNIKIKITEYREYDTNIYVADIELTDSSYLQTAFANSTYGKNVTAKTSETANLYGAILAINGDYYGVQEKGYVLKNGVIYRNIARTDQEDLVIYEDGSFGIILESEVDLESLLDSGVYNLLSFGPVLLMNNNIMIDTDTEVDKAKSSNPRTAIGIIDDLHYIFVVSDGRTDESEGLTLYQLASFMKELNVNILYNLDGGGSSTMYFNGKIINKPTSSGRTIKERSVSDIVYIGY